MKKRMLCCGAVLCFMALIGSQKVSAAENLENACVWLKDEGYSFTPDLDADDLEEQTIASEYVTNVWPVMGSDGVITDELLNYSYSGTGDDYMNLTEDGKYLYFFTDISSDLSQGTLKYINLNEKKVFTVDTNVYIAGSVNMEADGSALYQKADENGKELYYFDGQNSFPVAENVRYASLDGKTAYYEKYDESENSYSLYGRNVYNDASEKMLASDLYWTDAESMQKYGYYYLCNGRAFYVLEGNKLCRSSLTSDTEVIAENVDQVISCDGRKIWYTKRIRSTSLIDYIDFSGSQYTENEISAFSQAVREEEDLTLGVAQIYSYDFQTGREEKATEDLLVEEAGITFIMPTSEDQRNRILTVDLSYMLPENMGKAFADTVFSGTDLSDIESAGGALYEWFSGQLDAKMATDGISVRFIILGEESKAYTLDGLKLFSDEISDCGIFHEGENVAVIKNNRLYTAETFTEGEWRDTGVENADSLAVIGDQLFYMKNEDLYFYHDGNSVYLGPNCDCWKSYEDGSVLLLSYFDGQVYGGNLWYIDANGNSQEIDENVTRFAALESGEILYVKEGKAILYSGGIKTRVADDVRLMLTFGEKEIAGSVYSAW